MATQRQIFMQGLGAKTMPQSTPQAIIPAVKTTTAQTMTPPKPKPQVSVMSGQARSVQEALAKTKAVQKTYGVPGAK